MSGGSFTLPWGSWFGDRERRFTLPDGWTADVRGIRGAPPLSPDGVRTALRAPVGSEPLRALARGRRDAVVVVEDLTRPARLSEILPLVLAEIRAGGVPDGRVTVLVGCGAHAPLSRPELVRKVGAAVLARHAVINHHPYEDLVDRGTSRRGIPVRISRVFAEADLKIAVGSVLPHPYAGFGGGAKIVLPGVSGIETLEANHRPAVTGVQGGLGRIEGNTARQEMEEIALAVGLEAIVNVVTDDRRRTVGVFAGHPVAAHRAAVAFARAVYATAPPDEPADAALVNAYPKDTELLQVGNAFNVLRSGTGIPVRAGGPVIVTAACPQGRGVHSLHGPGMRLYRSPVVREWLEGRPVIVHAPALNTADARVSFWEGYPFERTWPGAVRRLVSLAGPAGRLAVFPCGPMQLLEADR